ncbi:MAG: TIGR03790 family protein [Armatimonadetes bacterium]|nr:TIGR03790 family protein [Armatimonadota bacterium]
MAQWLTLFLLTAVIAPACAGGGPRNVLVVRNTASTISKNIASHYIAARRIPPENICDIRCSTAEIVSNSECAVIVGSIRGFLAASPAANHIDYIVLTKGIPLGVNLGYPSGPISLTSILTCLSEPDVTQYIKNPYGPTAVFVIESAFSHQLDLNGRHLYLVTRLDGYTENDVNGMIDRSVMPPGTGAMLIDRQAFRDSVSSAYKTLNNRLQTANALLVSRGVPTIYDDSSVFVGGQTGLMGYFSWGSNDGRFSMSAYRSNSFAPGSIADTYVSTSARTFVPTSAGQSLIADLIAQGACAVSGYVSEPYTAYSTYADVLFDRYTKGYNMAESFYASCPEIYWKTVVVGDPLLAPFATPPQVSIDSPDVPLTGTATITVSASDESGISKVDIYFDGKLIGAASASPFSATVDTTQYTVGSHNAEAVAYENSPVATQGFGSATVTVQNPVSNLQVLADAFISSCGQGVRASDKVVTAGTSEMGGGEFYIQEQNRFGGIRVVSSDPVEEGDIVTVTGPTVNDTGEESISATTVTVTKHLLTLLAPVAMPNWAIGGGDFAQAEGVSGGKGLRNIGLLVRTNGKVTYVGAVGEDFFYIDDGSNLLDGSGHKGLRVACRGLARPALNNYLLLTGISASQKLDGHVIRVLKLRRDSDVTVVNH